SLNINVGDFSSDQVLDLLMIAKYYERIGDHATNIAEWAEFSLTGKHRDGEKVYEVFS
ncbi:MAG: PhoU domain-containing protein, partial [Oliverpabstia sp.]|nr:PhoU domain-containing protein [Oliverpabstia sp.]